MKILMINYEYPPLGGGGGVFNKQLAEELAKNHRVTVVTSKFSHQRSREKVNHVELIRVPVPMRSDRNAASLVSMLAFFPASLWAGHRLLKNQAFDLIHSMFAIPSSPAGVLLAKRFGKPHLLSILGGDIYDPSKKLSPHRTPLLFQTVRAMMRRSDLTVSLSADVRQRAVDYYGISKPIRVVHLGIPKPRVVLRKRADYDFDKDDILLITVGRLVARKSNSELIQALAELADPRFKLIIVGDGPEKQRLQTLAGRLNIQARVRFVGNIGDEEKFTLLAMSDIYVSSSRHEGFGIVFLEAMATGLPVVCYDKGGQADYLKTPDTGFLVKVGDRRRLGQRIAQLGSDPELRKRISAHNKAYMNDFYIETCADRYLSAYRSLIESGGESPCK